MTRLRRAALPQLTENLLPGTWKEPAIGIVHLGIGNFHRAHEAVFTEEAMLKAGGDWSICGVTLQGDVSKRDVLMAQDGLYSIVERGPAGVKTTVVRALHEVLALPDDRPRLFALLTNAKVRIVSLTVTEKGYCRDAKTGEVDTHLPGIAHDLTQPDAPSTVPGIITDALRARRDAGIAPFTVLSCDNLAHNGAALRKVVTSYARMIDDELGIWIDKHVAFPSTMVDRIVPATTDADREAAHLALHMRDAVPVPCEPFRQWVVEDHFPTGRPAWDRVGAELVEDVTPFELAKLRMLNGAHSTLAYLSMLAGFETIDEAVRHPPLRTLVHGMLTHEVIPTLSVPTSFDLFAYRDALLDRFANPALKHRCAQIAMDGSQKLPQRLLAPIAQRLSQQKSIDRLALAVAAWMRFLQGQSDNGAAYAVNDPLSASLCTGAQRADADPNALVDTLLDCRDIFPRELANNEAFRAAIVSAVVALQSGTLAAIAQYAN